MKEAIEDLIEYYRRKVLSCQILISESKNDNQKNRVRAKLTVYKDVMRDLKQLLEDEQDET